MSATVYTKTEAVRAGEVPEGHVIPWQDGVVFRCPCGYRTVYIASPPHTIEFDDDGVLTLDPSCGYKARENLKRPQNWCHFHIKGGSATMCSDAQCPGGTGEIP